jgi:hypothetical protein
VHRVVLIDNSAHPGRLLLVELTQHPVIRQLWIGRLLTSPVAFGLCEQALRRNFIEYYDAFT